MGRGRAKAKQTKVARALKYHSPETDLAALQRELSGRSRSGGVGPGDSDPDDNDLYDEYADYDDEDADDEADGRWAARRS
jgi:hypothetical protein